MNMKLLVVLALAAATANSASLEFVAQPGLPEGRIINGHDAAKGEAPFIVSLRTNSHFCAGSIIAEHWVVTAGHCLFQDSFQVVAGLHQRDDESDVQIRQVPSRAFQFVHEKYDGNVGPNDIGLIYIAEPFNFTVLARDGTAPVGKINVPSDKYEATGKGILFGWGRNNTGHLSNIMQTLYVNIINYYQCKAALPISAPLDIDNICSYTAGTSDGACNGDSGGPMIHDTLDGPVIVGIVSWGYTPCAFTKLPSVYTKVSSFSPWIQKTIYNFNADRLSN